MAQGRLGQPGRLGRYTYQLKEGQRGPRGPGRTRRGVVAWGAQGHSAAALGNRTCPTRPTTQLASSGPTRTARRTTRRFSQWHDARQEECDPAPVGPRGLPAGEDGPGEALHSVRPLRSCFAAVSLPVERVAHVPQAVRLVSHVRDGRSRAQDVKGWWRGWHGVHQADKLARGERAARQGQETRELLRHDREDVHRRDRGCLLALF